MNELWLSTSEIPKLRAKVRAQGRPHEHHCEPLTNASGAPALAPRPPPAPRPPRDRARRATAPAARPRPPRDRATLPSRGATRTPTLAFSTKSVKILAYRALGVRARGFNRHWRS